MDISGHFWSLVAAARTELGYGVPVGASKLKELREEEREMRDTLLTTSQALDEVARNALSRASVEIAAVLAALEGTSFGSTGHLQSRLLLCDADLLSVGSSLRTFTETLDKVSVVTAERSKGQRPRKRKLLPGAAHARDKAIREAEGRCTSTAAIGLVDHLRHTVSIWEQRIAAKRLKVALAKEELALFKGEIFLYGRCGVLSCSDDVAEKLRLLSNSVSKEAASPHANVIPQTYCCGESEAASEGAGVRRKRRPLAAQPGSASGFGNTYRVVDSIMQKAAQTVKSAGTRADSALQVAFTGSQSAARHIFSVGAVSVDEMFMFRTALGGEGDRPATITAGEAPSASSSKLPELTPLDLSKEEEAQLEEKNVALLQIQHEATAQDAKAIEASIRELSQLTSLMNEQVVQQTEQVTALVKNTELAQVNVRKAVEEVKQPLQAFWNPTRQLVALLWFCMALLLGMNWIVR